MKRKLQEMARDPLLLAFSFLPLALMAFPSGAPNCAISSPHHLLHTRTEVPLPFSTSAVKKHTTSTSSNHYEVSLGDPDSEVEFRGFRVVAHSLTGPGRWFLLPGSAAQNLTNRVACGVTHTDNAKKKFVKMRYETESQDDDLFFKAIIVKDFTTFWTDILIDVSAEELVGDIIEEVVEAHEDLKEQIPVCAGDEREGYQQDD